MPDQNQELYELPEVFYWGCYDSRRGGHGYYASGGRSIHAVSERCPWGYKIDAGLAPVGIRGELPQGVAAIHHKDGWTAIAFWDRTGDTRGNSNSGFVFNAEIDFETGIALAREKFPEMFRRFNFEVVQVDA